MLIGITLLLGLSTGLVTFLVAQRWPRMDPLAPTISPPTATDEVRNRRGLHRFLGSRFDPNVVTGFSLTIAMLVVIVGALIIGLLLVMIHTNSGLARWDHSFSEFGAHHASHTSTQVLKDLSHIGGALVIVPLARLVGVIETVRLKSRSVVAFLFVVVGGQFLLADVVKAV